MSFKRVTDLMLSIAAGILLLPVIAGVAVLIGCRLGRPIFFRQSRVGKGGKEFTLVKFRTMLDRRTDDGDLLSDHERMTPLGAWLRRSSLDELPELWNVIRGEMSLVGPRPLLPEYLPRYSSRQARRHEVRPGITGMAQVNGRNLIAWEDRLEMDVWYVDHRSEWLDLKILFRTVGSVVSQAGVSAEGHVTMPPFLGSSRSIPQIMQHTD